MGTLSDVPCLVDTETGSEFSRYELEDAAMTIEVTQHPYRQLAGASFVTLTDDVCAAVNDDRWERILGLTIILPGGCEVDVDKAELDRALEDIEAWGDDYEMAADDRPDLISIEASGDGSVRALGLLVPLVVNDADLPSVRILLPISVLKEKLQSVRRGGGSHARFTGDGDGEYTRCKHTGSDFGKTRCRGCMRRFWMAKAAEEGLIDE